MSKTVNFAFTNQPATQSDDIWARWPAGQPYLKLDFTLHTKSCYDRKKQKAPKEDTKTPKSQRVEKTGIVWP